MTNLKLSSKMHIMIIVTSVIVAIGIAVGVICQFVFSGYFNYGSEYSSYSSVVVDYAYLDYSNADDVKEICDNAFKAEGVSYYTSIYGETSQGGEFTFKFSCGVSSEKIDNAAKAINSILSSEDSSELSSAYYHNAETLLGGAPALKFASIALAAAVVFQFAYFVIRFGLAAALTAFVADVHNLAIYVSLLAITRVPLGSSSIVFGVLCVLMTMIGCSLMFDRMRKNLKNEKFATLGVKDRTDVCAAESLTGICLLSVFTAVAAVIIFVLLSISALSVTLVMTPVILAVLSAVANVYGTAFFIPSVYHGFIGVCSKIKLSRSNKPAKKA